MRHLTVLVRREGPRVYVEVGVDLYGSDAETSRLDQSADAASDDALPNTADDAATDEDELEVLRCHPGEGGGRRRTHSIDYICSISSLIPQ